jgi:hypothetical protein
VDAHCCRKKRRNKEFFMKTIKLKTAKIIRDDQKKEKIRAINDRCCVCMSATHKLNARDFFSFLIFNSNSICFYLDEFFHSVRIGFLSGEVEFSRNAQKISERKKNCAKLIFFIFLDTNSWF